MMGTQSDQKSQKPGSSLRNLPTQVWEYVPWVQTPLLTLTRLEGHICPSLVKGLEGHICPSVVTSWWRHCDVI